MLLHPVKKDGSMIEDKEYLYVGGPNHGKIEKIKPGYLGEVRVLVPTPIDIFGTATVEDLREAKYETHSYFAKTVHLGVPNRYIDVLWYDNIHDMEKLVDAIMRDDVKKLVFYQ